MSRCISIFDPTMPTGQCVHIAEDMICLLTLLHSGCDIPGSDHYLETGYLNWFCSVSACKHLKQNHNYTHSLLLAGSYFLVSQIQRVTPRTEVYHSDPSTDRSMKIVQQLEQVFDWYHKMFIELKGKISNSHHNVSAKKKKTLTILKHCF
jgi:hypothetical protein